MGKLKFEQDENLGFLTLSNPQMNIIGPDFITEFTDLIPHLETSGLRAMILRAEGDNFSAGADVKMFKGLSVERASTLVKNFMEVIHRLESMPFPTVAVVHGLCIAGGLELVLACDFIWAAETAKFAQAEALIGTIPLGGGAQRLAQRCGPVRAREIVMTGNFFDAQTFEHWNIINRIVPADELSEKSLIFAKNLSDGPTRAHVVTKSLLREHQDSGLLSADRLILRLAPPLFESVDMREGINSFLQEGPGKAKFSGK